ncbi:MAG: response regulator [Candidatus Harrisonbacteria bacterium]|nr:response regulator [Candidatus Harrisonbacteria bacterium]
MMDASKKVLIVEDELPMLDALHDALELAKITGLKARDGSEGLSVALREHPAAILLDILMPVMDGFQMLERLRKDMWGKDAKVLILTNFSTDEVRHRANEYGVLDFLVKADHGIDEIIKKVKSILV